MNILIAYASKHGSTFEIAEAIADRLRQSSFRVAIRSVEEVYTTEVYDAVIIGSAVYMGRWMQEAQQFIEENRDDFGRVPVWLFSSGPLGDETEEGIGNPHNLDVLMALTKAEGHQIFDGRLDKERLGLGEKLVVSAVKVPYGDFRDWDAIRDWADTIAAGLVPVKTPTPTI
ncbi:MAG: flavodoxin domain-containing protein [Candidatus Promineifilaceae bacterium]